MLDCMKIHFHFMDDRVNHFDRSKLSILFHQFLAIAGRNCFSFVIWENSFFWKQKGKKKNDITKLCHCSNHLSLERPNEWPYLHYTIAVIEFVPNTTIKLEKSLYSLGQNKNAFGDGAILTASKRLCALHTQTKCK